MSDREDLRSILRMSDSGDDAGPLDGERAAGAAAEVAEAEEDETNALSPEELVAESVRQTNEALGIADEPAGAEPAEASAADDADVDPSVLEKARQWDEYQAGEAARKVAAQKQDIEAKAQESEAKREAEKQRFRTFYKNEQVRLLDQIDADAENAPNPRAYRATHRQNAIDACRAAEDLKMREVDADFDGRFNDLDAQYRAIDAQAQMEQQRPQYADWLITKLDLPKDDLTIRAEILRDNPSLEEMTNRARHIQWFEQRAAQQNQQVDQAQRDIAAKEVKFKQPHPASATNTPRRAKPVEYAEKGPERKKQLAAILSMTG